MDECCENGMKYDELREVRLKEINKKLEVLIKEEKEHDFVMKVAEVVSFPIYLACLLYWLLFTSLAHTGNPFIWWVVHITLFFSMGYGSRDVFNVITKFIAGRILNVVWFMRNQINKFKNRNNKEIEQ